MLHTRKSRLGKAKGPTLTWSRGQEQEVTKHFGKGPFDYIIAAWKRRLEKARTGE